MTNKPILLEKGKFTRFVGSSSGIWKIMTLASILCLVVASLIGCGEPNLDDPKVREEVIAKAIDQDSLQTRRAPSGEELYYAPNQERPYAGWVKIRNALYEFQNGKPNGIYISWYSNGQNRKKGTFRNGEEDSLWTQWYENGQKMSEGTYKLIDTVVLTPLESDGQEVPTVTHKLSMEDGLWTEWYTNGNEK